MDRYVHEVSGRLPEAEVPEAALALRGPRYLARYVRYPRALRNYHPQAVHVADHSYAHCLSAFRGVPSVITIHDLLRQVIANREEVFDNLAKKLLDDEESGRIY